MKGYKVFTRPKGRDYNWEGPIYSIPDNWKIKAGSILIDEGPPLDTNRNLGCSKGIHFYPSKKEAFNAVEFLGSRYVAIYECQTLPDSRVVRPYGRVHVFSSENASVVYRTDKIKLVKRLGLFRNKKKISKIH